MRTSVNQWIFWIFLLCFISLNGEELETCENFNNDENSNWKNVLDNNSKRGIKVAWSHGFGNGLVATYDIRPNQVIIDIPMSFIICRDNAISIQGGAKYLSEKIQSDAKLVPLLLLLEMSKDLKGISTWKNYLDELPKHVQSAYLFKDEILGELQDQKLAIQLREIRQQHIAYFEQQGKTLLTEALKRDGLEMVDKYVSEEAFLWANSICDSRALTIDGLKFLVPLADMFNYKPNPFPRISRGGAFFKDHHIVTKNRFLVKSERFTAKDEQVFMDYGDNPNTVYLTYHGFVPDLNPFDCLELSFSIPKDTEHFDLIMQVARFYLNAQKPYTVTCVSLHELENPEYRPGVLQLKYIASLSASALKTCIDESRKINSQQEFMAARARCIDTNKISKQDLLPMLVAENALMTGTVEDDKSILTAADPSNSELVLALRYRISRKRLLYDLMLYLRTGIRPEVPKEFLTWERARKKITGLGPEDDPSVTLEDKIARLNTWVATQHFPIAKIKAVPVPGLRVGTIATENLDAEEPYLVVPDHAVMNLQTVSSSLVYPLLHRLSFEMQRSDPFHELLMFLLFERHVMGTNSYWWPYISLLPSSTDMYAPVFFEDDVLGLLKTHTIYDDVIKYQNDVKRKFQVISRFFETNFGAAWLPEGAFTFENYRWAHAILDSRSIWWNGQRNLVPLLDMVNCNAENETRAHKTYHDYDFGGAVTHANQVYGANDQVFENYGQPNSNYFRWHGFSLEVNAFDCILIRDKGKEFCLKMPLSGNRDALTHFGSIHILQTRVQQYYEDLGMPHVISSETDGSISYSGPKRSIIEYLLRERRLLRQLINDA